MKPQTWSLESLKADRCKWCGKRPGDFFGFVGFGFRSRGHDARCLKRAGLSGMDEVRTMESAFTVEGSPSNVSSMQTQDPAETAEVALTDATQVGSQKAEPEEALLPEKGDETDLTHSVSNAKFLSLELDDLTIHAIETAEISVDEAKVENVLKDLTNGAEDSDAKTAELVLVPTFGLSPKAIGSEELSLCQRGDKIDIVKSASTERCLPAEVNCFPVRNNPGATQLTDDFAKTACVSEDRVSGGGVSAVMTQEHVKAATTRVSSEEAESEEPALSQTAARIDLIKSVSAECLPLEGSSSLLIDAAETIQPIDDTANVGIVSEDSTSDARVRFSKTTDTSVAAMTGVSSGGAESEEPALSQTAARIDLIKSVSAAECLPLEGSSSLLTDAAETIQPIDDTAANVEIVSEDSTSDARVRFSKTTDTSVAAITGVSSGEAESEEPALRQTADGIDLIKSLSATECLPLEERSSLLIDAAETVQIIDDIAKVVIVAEDSTGVGGVSFSKRTDTSVAATTEVSYQECGVEESTIPRQEAVANLLEGVLTANCLSLQVSSSPTKGVAQICAEEATADTRKVSSEEAEPAALSLLQQGECAHVATSEQAGRQSGELNLVESVSKAECLCPSISQPRQFSVPPAPLTLPPFVSPSVRDRSAQKVRRSFGPSNPSTQSAVRTTSALMELFELDKRGSQRTTKSGNRRETF